jgi:nitroimidazol reductase NimA-like FMN-containing flavoprotein (pyridoxamine 5'-phosphate oxidase superfamily)
MGARPSRRVGSDRHTGLRRLVPLPAMTEPMASTGPASDRTRVRRKPERGRYDRAIIDAILDAALVGHVGYVVDGQPYVTPTAVWRQGDELYWHGSSASRMLRTTRTGIPVCVTVTQVDALVLARSGFDHSFDYRSVMLLGTAHEIEDEDAKRASLEAFVEHLFPGRWAQLRPPTRQELKATSVLAMPIAEASAKIRDIGAHDEPGDETWPAWGGSIPLRLIAGPPVPDEHVGAGSPPPALAAWLAGDGGWTPR